MGVGATRVQGLGSGSPRRYPEDSIDDAGVGGPQQG